MGLSFALEIELPFGLGLDMDFLHFNTVPLVNPIFH